MTSEQLVESRKLAKEITDFVKENSGEPVYTRTVIDQFAKGKNNRTTVKLTLWDLIVGNQILVGDKYELSVQE